MIRSLVRSIKRQITNKFAYIIIALLLSMITPFVTQIVANASPQGTFDGLFDKHADRLILKDDIYSQNCDFQNITDNWLDTILEAEPETGTDDWKQSLQSAVSNGSYVVTQTAEMSPKPTTIPNTPQDIQRATVTVTWTEDTSLSLDWFNPYSPNFPPSFESLSIRAVNSSGTTAGLKTVTFHLSDYWGTCSLYSSDYTPELENSEGPSIIGLSAVSSNSIDYNYLFKIKINEDNFNVPENYHGLNPVQNTPNPEDKEVIFPSVSATVTDKTVIFKLDELPFTPCSVNYMISYSDKPDSDYGETIIETLKNGWTQIFSGDITLEDWRKGGETYDSRVIDFKHNAKPNDEIIVNSPDYGSILVFAVVNTEWQGAPYKSCGDNGNPEEFEYIVKPRLQFIDVNGSNYAIDGTKCDPSHNVCNTTIAKSDLMDCFTSSFPFINITECKNAVAVVGERLTFNKVQFGNSWIFSPQCQQLGTLGDWIGVQNKTVCPNFSSTVRNTIDPFVTFILGLIVVSFIARTTGREF